MIRPIVAPTVPLGKERVRVCLHAGNTLEEVRGLSEAIGAWLVLEIAKNGGRGDDLAKNREATFKSRI